MIENSTTSDRFYTSYKLNSQVLCRPQQLFRSRTNKNIMYDLIKMLFSRYILLTYLFTVSNNTLCKIYTN